MTKRKQLKAVKTPKQLALLAAKKALDKKAFNIVLLDVRPWQTLMDYTLIVSAQSTKQTQGIAKYIKESLKQEDIFPLNVEGMEQGKWILMDYNDVIVHVFFEYVRDIYDIEMLWHDAPRVRIPKSYYK